MKIERRDAAIWRPKYSFSVSVWKFRTKNPFFALPCESLGPKSFFSCFRVKVLDQKFLFHASV